MTQKSSSDLLAAFGSDAVTPPQDAQEAPAPVVEPAPGQPAVPLDPDNIERARSARRGRPPKDPNAPPAKRGRPPKTAANASPVEEVGMTLDPAMVKALKGTLAESYAIALSLLAFAPVVFTPEEKPAIEEGLYYCVETYLPAGMSKHLPAFLLVAVSLSAINRARAEKRAAAEAKEKGE